MQLFCRERGFAVMAGDTRKIAAWSEDLGLTRERRRWQRVDFSSVSEQSREKRRLSFPGFWFEDFLSLFF